jgi:two-component system chemotaxis response regulator CheY
MRSLASETNMRAMVVDDSRVMRAILASILGELGFDVCEASDGAAALEQLQLQAEIELVLVDWNMPVMNGLEFIQNVRADRSFDRTRIMMVTTETDAEQVNRALDAGADEYVMKPFTKEVLVAKISMLDCSNEA